MIKRSNYMSRQAGFSIIEGLVSILIFSLGVMALVSLQATSVAQSTSAKYRSEASLLANELIGQMWVGDRTATALQSNFNTGGAKYNEWLTNVQAVLPGSAASAPTVTVSNTGQVTVNIYWKAPNEPASMAEHNFITIAQIK
jgi:type IV pilus assembly protein PilV